MCGIAPRCRRRLYFARRSRARSTDLNDRLDAHRITRGLSPAAADWLHRIDVFESVGSTNTYLMTRAEVDDVDGHVCLAEFQSAGRGRRGRTWTTPSGQSIALSLGHRLAVPLARLGALSLVVGLAVASALEHCGVTGVGLKWPNDIILEGAKLGGILIEVVPGRAPALIVIGVGVNVSRGSQALASVETPVAVTDDVAPDLDRSRLAAALIDAIHEFAVQFERFGFSHFHAAWDALNIHVDRRVTVVSGADRIDGTVRGVTETGELIVETEAGTRSFNSGEVSLRANG